MDTPNTYGAGHAVAVGTHNTHHRPGWEPDGTVFADSPLGAGIGVGVTLGSLAQHIPRWDWLVRLGFDPSLYPLFPELRPPYPPLPTLR